MNDRNQPTAVAPVEPTDEMLLAWYLALCGEFDDFVALTAIRPMGDLENQHDK